MPPPILALVIGINEYQGKQFSNLNGAVADADAFETYLKESLEVPASNIISLRNLKATRKAILAGLCELRDSPKYAKDKCAIIIFFAGHGAQVDMPVDWSDWSTATGKIEELCPCDIGMTIDNVVVQGIPDRTISTIVNHIADIKGNNITMILDCCSSGGINRSYKSLDPEEFIPRRISNPPPLESSVDRQIWSRGSGGSRGGGQTFDARYQASHVLLAACGRDQLAYETRKEKRGMFTTTLMKVLKSENINNLTYTALMDKLKMPPQQTPHCEGQGIHSRLFDNSTEGADGRMIVINNVKEGPIVMSAGEAQGITIGSRYSIHANNLIDTKNSPNPSLGYLVVNTVDNFSSTLIAGPSETSFMVPRLCYAKLAQNSFQTISIYSESKPWLARVFPAGVLENLGGRIVDEASSCDLQLTLTGGRVVFDRWDTHVKPHLGARIRRDVSATDIEKIREVVRCFRHFHYHLTRSGPQEFRNVWMELKELKSELDSEYLHVLKPVGDNLIEKNPASIVVDEDKDLGMTIFNQTDVPLYPYLFYFDPTELSIFDWYKPPIGAGLGKNSTQVNAPLPPKSRLTLGYGDGGATSWQFIIPSGEKKDLGFFKLFITTRPTYFESVTQTSPFDEEENSDMQSRAGKSTAAEPPKDLAWGAQLVTIVQLLDPDASVPRW